MFKSGIFLVMLMSFVISCGSGGASLKDDDRERYDRTVDFSGYTWYVKASDEKVGPGPNIFSDSDANVWVDTNGWLHLKITENDGIWNCAEIVCAKSLGYGSYRVELATPVVDIGRNAVLGIFIWDGDTSPYYREIDIELSRWGDAGYDNSQYVIQPYALSSNIHRFEMSYTGQTFHSFDWRSGGLNFMSGKADGTTLEAWSYAPGDNYPVPGNEKLRLNFWLLEGGHSSDGGEKEIVIKKFSFNG